MRSTVAFLVCLTLGACSKEEKAGGPGEKPAAQGETQSAVASAGEDGNATTGPEAPATASTSEDRDTEGAPDETAGSGDAAPPGAEPFQGPCKVAWSDGRILTFKYQEDGGSISVDTDGDGKRNDCGTFKSSEGRITYLRIDEGCNRSSDATVKIKYDDDESGVASVNVIRGDETRRMSLLPLPSFGSVLPGYVLPARRRDLTIDAKDGKVQSVRIKKGAGRPAAKISVSYDEAGRVSGLIEDAGLDGKAELQFSYGYDEAGNVESIRSVVDGREVTGTLDYGCWD